MAKEIVYRLSNPGYTIYHRAALGGLAATVRAWGANKPAGIQAELQRDFVRLAWGDELADQDALRNIIEASFKLTDDKLIDLPGQGIRADQHDLRLAIHNGIVGTFLQHNKMRPGEKGSRKIELKFDGADTGEIFTYKAVDSYAHQKAQKTGLLEAKQNGALPVTAAIPQWMMPGATGGAEELDGSAEEVFLLMFLMVGCSIFLLRPRNYKEKAQSCLVVPDVVDLVAFASDLHRMASASAEFKRLSHTYLGRVVGGAEEAALRFLIDLSADDIVQGERSVSGCAVVAMGKVAWDANQINRSLIAKVRGDYPEMAVFREAYGNLGQAKTIKLKDGQSFAIPNSPIPELIAANLAAERHWCANFRELVSEKKDFERMSFFKGGLKAMKEAIKDVDDQAIIHAFHDAWRLTMSNIYERAKRDNLKDPDGLIQVEREKIRNAILRAKNAELLAGWFLRFCAEATKEGGRLNTLQQEGERIRQFIFNPRNVDRFQNLCLFALVSYAGKDKTETKGEN
ncbi:MAG: type I-MYXAN CRISPR-associated Cas8a1/Cmx1 [Acidobacteriota bacterium]